VTGVFHTPAGNMRVLNVLLYYDGPALFSCEDLTGQKYVAFLVEESDEGDRWFLVPISNGRLEQIRAGKLGLRECVQHPEDGFLLDVFVSPDGSEGGVHVRDASTLQDHELPGPQVVLSG